MAWTRRHRGRKIAAVLTLIAIGAIGIWALRGLYGVPDLSRPTSRTLPASASTTAAAESGKSDEVLISLAGDGQLGDLAAVSAKHPDLAATLAESLASFVANDTGLRASDDWRAVANFRVFGAAVHDGEVWLFAHEFADTFSFTGGRLIEEGGMSAPIRIRLSSDSLACLSIDEPEDGEGYGESIDRMMPAWAAQRAAGSSYATDVHAVRDAAGRWAKPLVARNNLITLPRPAHADPHHHQPDVYGLPGLSAAVSGIRVRVIPVPRSSDETPGIDDLEKASTSPDGRFECFFPLTGWEGLVVRDNRTGQWMHVDGPRLDLTIDHIAWAGSTLLFDKVDVGYSEPRPEIMTSIHVEVDLSKRTVQRVVPLGPYTANWHPGR